MNSTTTHKAPTVTLDTPVSVRIGSDQYQAKVASVTAATVTVHYNKHKSPFTFRPYISSSLTLAGGQWIPVLGWRAERHLYLVIGESETVLSREF